LLAPAGDWDCARAAVENGADAIYFGLEKFNARMRARNFTEADLPALMTFLHRRGVRGYVSFNTLVFPAELADAERTLRAILAADVDAALVQDVGIGRLIRRLSPDFPIHASTQMTITSAGGVAFARDLGFQRVVLARECSLREIERIQQASRGLGDPAGTAPDTPATSGAGRLALPLEVFVHGALCVAYSGQCLTSEALGGRSANRGICAQACRMPYDLVADGRVLPLGDRRYLLSPQDLAGLTVLPDLIRAGVAALKIEGRLKSPEYVANITRVYRHAIDQVVARLPPTAPPSASVTAFAESLLREARYDLEMAFSRGLYTGWLRGTNNQQLVHGRFGKKRGVYLGTVTRVHGDRVFAELEGPLKPGDGVVFDAGRPDLEEEGGRVYHLERGSRRSGGATEAALRFGRGDIQFRRVHPGDKLWKTSDPVLEERLRQTYAGAQPRFRRPVRIEVQGAAGQSLILTAQDESGDRVRVRSAVRLMKAEKHPLTTARLREQLGRLGGTPFRLGELRNQLEGELRFPRSELNRLRREMVAQLESRRLAPSRWTLVSPAVPVRGAHREENPAATGRSGVPGDEPELIVLVRRLAQLEAALASGVRTIYCDFEDPQKYREAVRRCRAWPARAADGPDDGPTAGRPAAAFHDSPDPPGKAPVRVAPPSPPASPAPSPVAMFVAPPRIFKPGEDWILKQVRSCEADGYLVRNYDHLGFFAEARRIGDYSLNVANELAADYFIRRHGLERVTASYDLNHRELATLLEAAPPAWFEITLHQHMPMFHMEHCLFCAFLSQGTDFTNCGRPCDRHELRLRDRVGAEHPVQADLGCRNTVFNARAQTGAEHVTRFLALGARKFRVEFLHETPDQVGQTIAQYQRLLRGEIRGAELWRQLRLLNQLGVTRGPLG
jgi:putative protease